MLLAVDIGNTFVKFGLYDDKGLNTRFSIPSAHTADPQQLESNIGDKLDLPISRAIVCSVVPAVSGALTDILMRRNIETRHVRHEWDFGMTVHYHPPWTLGADRLVNSFSAVQKYGSPVIVCSFGTATTVDVVAAANQFLGGLIAPGLKTSAKSLEQAAQLPEISISLPQRLIGDSTTSAICSGVVNGHAAMVGGVLEKLIVEIGAEPIVIATGGYAKLMAGMVQRIDTVDENLTLDGLCALDARTDEADSKMSK